MIAKGISIIVCCYNSESRLSKTLEHLAKQEIRNDVPVELILVNNASTDCTRDIAQAEWAKYDTDFLFRVVVEEKQGIIFARIRGVHESQYEYILFCDDDNWLQSDYLQKAFDLMESNAKIGALGGQSIAVSDIDFPEWFSDFQISWAIGEQANESGDVSKRGWIWGAGLITRRTLLTKVLNNKYPFLNQGRTGSDLTSGDDCEICKRILLSGYILYYDKSLLLYHYIPHERLSWKYKKKLFEGIDLSELVLQKYDLIIQEMNKNLLRKIIGILYNICKLLKQKTSNYKLKSEIYARIGLLLKSTKFVNDLEYKSIIRYLLKSN